MILFVAPNPHKVKQREGFLQRVMAIDRLFPDDDKQYLEDLKNPEQRLQALARAEMIYVHSVYHANKIQPLYRYYGDKIVTDMHGVVPEEEALADNWEMQAVMAQTERMVFEYGKYFVAVTEAMIDHFTSKYPTTKARKWTVLPISHGIRSLQDGATNARDGKMVIYAGGSQPWQNVGRMVEAINKVGRRYDYMMLTHDPEAFAGIREDLHDVVTIKGVPSNEVGRCYTKASLGFVLRDDIIINRVACPTKLIEYLAYGVLPVVLSDQIGDFKQMGYRYITLEHFMDSPIEAKQIEADVKHNFKVFADYCAKIDKGETALRKLRSQLAERRKAVAYDQNLLQLELDAQGLRDTILRQEYQIGVYKQKLSEYAKALEEQLRQHARHKNLPEHLLSAATRVTKHIRPSRSQGSNE